MRPGGRTRHAAILSWPGCFLPCLRGLDSACAVAWPATPGVRHARLSADAHHVARGLLLKLDDQGLASLAADRSMRAAQVSGDPVTIGASARIITHTLMSGGQPAPLRLVPPAATPRCLTMTWSPPPLTSLSVYGALLLRGRSPRPSTANRGIAMSCSAEADEAARRLGMDADGNLRGTLSDRPMSWSTA